MSANQLNTYVLGIWDGHDSGAAIVKGNQILSVINEERLSRRKLEVRFPKAAIQACLESLNLCPKDIPEIVVPTSDAAKTLTRIFPSQKEQYYLIRRRKKVSNRFMGFKKYFKYRFTEIKPIFLTKMLSKWIIKRELKKLGFKNYSLTLVNHHLSHAAGAAFCSGFQESLVFTLDGVGDGLSGTINNCKQGEFKEISKIKANRSFGIFFEHVTNLMNMRELEDEGKVMALANYAYPIPDDQNPLLHLFKIEGLSIKAKYSSTKMFRELKKILWRYPSEQFAYMAQRTLEVKIPELVKNAINETGINNIAIAGGVASNVKVNMLLRELPEVNDLFIFPHMGDGGLAIGAALLQNYNLNHISSYSLNSTALGIGYEKLAVQEILDQEKINYEFIEDITSKTAQLIADRNIILWFQGRMEFGPRAMGFRSILARPDSVKVKDDLNLSLKKRVWYQPFCPSLLLNDAKEMFIDFKGTPDKFMTSAYRVKPEKLKLMEGVTNIDGSCRPQIINEPDSLYHQLLLKLKKLTGHGVVLNTSFNMHGEPLVCSPEDAIRTFKEMKCKYLVLDHFLVSGNGYVEN